MSRAQKVNSRVVQTNPMRYPDERDERQMGRRGWWLVVIGFLIPGSAQVLAGNKRLGRFGLGATIVTWVFVAVMLGLFLFAKESFLSVLDQTWILYVARALLIAYAVLWLILAIDTLRLVRFVRTRTKARVGIAVLSAALMVVSTGTALYAANLVGVTGETIDNIFTDEAVLPEDNGRYNILLLGADSGEGRDSMRFDSISVASVDMKTGQVTVIGIPRDMPHVPFNPDSPMYQLYPNGHEGHYDPECGWDSKINQLNTELDLCRDGAAIYPNAKKNNSTPGIEATRDAAEGVTGLEIQYYVFLDMDHFAQLIDAVGGVNINVLERIPEGGGPAYEGQSADEWATGWIEAGQQHMDGRTAQWYARSRYTTSDWDRMRRQGELQAAILGQIDAQTLLTRFQELAKAGTELVDTDLPKSLLSRFVNVAGKARALEMKRIELVPPLVDAEDPDFAAIRQMLHDEFNPASPSDTPTSESEGEQG